jgi:hypothetical protein
MSFSPNDSRIKVTRSLEDSIAEATNIEQMKVILREEALRTNLIVPDAINSSVLHEVDVAAPRRFAKTVEIGGIKKTFEGDSELEVEREYGAFLKETFSQPVDTTEQPRNERGQFVAEQAKLDEAAQAELLRRSEIELRFKRGEIDSATMLRETGAIKQYLNDQGIDMAALQDASASKLRQSWEAATEEFQQTEEGRRWPGGQSNFKTLGEVLISMGAADQPNSENIRLAAEYLRENDMLEESPEVAAGDKIKSANSVEEIREALGRSSSFFGRG